MDIEKIKFRGWEGFRLSAAGVSAVVVPDIGGRVLSLAHNGQDIFFVNDECAGERFDFSSVTDLRKEKKRLGFRLWGGDKTWVAPEKDWWEHIPPLELDAAPYGSSLRSDGIDMMSPVCRETGLQIHRRFSMQPDGTMELAQTMVNKNSRTVIRGIWDVTQLDRPFDVYVPAVKENVRSYHLEDPTLPVHQVVIQEDDGFCRIPCVDDQLFKFGGVPTAGMLLCLREDPSGVLAFSKTFDLGHEASYLHRSAVEVYNSKDYGYLEVEVHAPAVALAPGQQASHRQMWTLNRFPRSLGPRKIWDELKRAKRSQTEN